MSLQTFICFIDLPKELQIQVWKHAIQYANKHADVGDLTNYAEAAGYNISPILESPISHERIHIYLLGGFSQFFGIMNTCRWSRLIVLEYWHGHVKRGKAGSSWSKTYREWLRGNVLSVLKECIEQVTQALGS